MPSLRVCSWNIWFDPICQRERVSKILEEISVSETQIACIQEVTESILRLIERTTEGSKDYMIVCESRPLPSYGQAFLVHKSLDNSLFGFKASFVPFSETQMNRKMAILYFPKLKFRIINVHLESEFIRNSTKPITKYGQLCEVLDKGLGNHIMKFEEAEKQGNHLKRNKTLVIGDFNMTSDDDEAFNNIISRRGYRLVSTGQLTYDYKKNGNITKKYQSSLDRAVSSFPLKCKVLDMLGQNSIGLSRPIGRDIYPSDHFGLSMILDIPH